MREKLLTMTDDEIRIFIREKLEPGHIRFDMSGYGNGFKSNTCYFENFEILKRFHDCGIWDFVSYLYLDAYKGTMTLYFQFWENSIPNELRNELSGINFEENLDSVKSVDIILFILKHLSIIPRKNGWRERRFF